MVRCVSGIKRGDKGGPGGHNLVDGEAAADELVRGELVAIGHDLAVTIEDPCRAEGDEQQRPFPKLLAGGLERLVATGQTRSD